MKTQADFLELFTGSLSLSNALGTSYATHNQSGDLTITAANNKVINGTATVPIVADGNDINIDPAWIQMGGDDLSNDIGDTNHLLVVWTGQEFYYSNKVVAA